MSSAQIRNKKNSDPVHTGRDPYAHHINLKTIKTSMTLKFVIILQNLIKAYLRKSGKSKYDRKLTEIDVETTRIRSRVNGVSTEYVFSVTNQAEGPAESSMICPPNYEIISESFVKNLQESTLRAYSIPVLVTNRTYNSAQVRRKQRHLTTINTRASVPSNCIKISTDTKMSKQTVPSLLLTNACHILNKIDEVSSIVEINGPDIICISESWLDSSISDSIISIGSSYIPYRKDRETLGGGVIAYVKTAIPSSRLSNLEEDCKEVLWLLLKPLRLPRPFSCIVTIVVYYYSANSLLM